MGFGRCFTCCFTSLDASRFLWALDVKQRNGCWNWQSTMWVASFAYSLIGLLLRFWFWFAQGSADMCTGSPTMLNLARFYWAHFIPESE